MRTTGTVKWFNDTRDFGFITPEGGKSFSIVVDPAHTDITEILELLSAVADLYRTLGGDALRIVGGADASSTSKLAGTS